MHGWVFPCLAQNVCSVSLVSICPFLKIFQFRLPWREKTRYQWKMYQKDLLSPMFCYIFLSLTENNCLILRASRRLLINAQWVLCGQWSICESLCLGRAERVAKAAWDRLMAVWWVIRVTAARSIGRRNESKLCYIGQSILSVMME